MEREGEGTENPRKTIKTGRRRWGKREGGQRRGENVSARQLERRDGHVCPCRHCSQQKSRPPDSLLPPSSSLRTTRRFGKTTRCRYAPPLPPPPSSCWFPITAWLLLQDWLKPYAVFCLLRDIFGTSEHWRWGKLAAADWEDINRLAAPGTEHHQYILFTYYLQFHLHSQASLPPPSSNSPSGQALPPRSIPKSSVLFHVCCGMIRYIPSPPASAAPGRIAVLCPKWCGPEGRPPHRSR